MAANNHIGFDLGDHPQRLVVCVSLMLKYGLDPIYNFGDIAVYIFRRFYGLKLPQF